VDRATSNVPWSRDEIIVACGLYFTLSFGQMHARNPRIVEVAGLLGRTPSSLAMKLTNLASLDPAHRARGVKGLVGHSRLDEEIWREFQGNWEEMVLLSEETLQGLEGPAVAVPEREHPSGDIATEIEGTRKIRTMQGFFRKVVFAAYDSTCCITGNPIGDLLVASHILPWSEFPKERLNPRNGLCLAAHFDRAFDRGLISFDSDLRLILSQRLRDYLPNETLETEFVRRAGQPLLCPDRFPPESVFMAYHRGRFGFDRA
jgi:putative restriction endonuclease